MLFRKKKKEPTDVKLARAAGRMAGKAVRTGRKAAAVATAAGLATRRKTAKVADAVSRKRKAARQALAWRKVRRALQRAESSLKGIGKAVAVAALTAGAAATVSEVVKRRRNA